MRPGALFDERRGTPLVVRNAPDLPPSSVYPRPPGARTGWITAQRGPKNALDPHVPYAFLWEEEADAQGQPIATVTIFLTNRECPYRCLMCDLWQNTLDTTVPPGAIAAQIRHALERLPPARQVKLYNAGSFFDPHAIPPGDFPQIAREVAHFETVIVECHPRLIDDRAAAFQQLLGTRLTVAVGLETVHPEILERLNKRFTLADFERAARFLQQNDIGLRVFLLVRPPFLSEADGVFWARRSLDVAFAAGADTCCVIPTRGGNGAMESLRAAGEFCPPSLGSLEAAHEYGLRKKAGRVYADMWDLEKFFTCACSPARARRLDTMNRTQAVPDPIACTLCAGALPLSREKP